MLPQQSIIHVTTDDDWAQSQPDGYYVPPGFAREGFIHCCYPTQLARVLRDFFANHDRVLLLVLDPALITAEIWHENPVDGLTHPHIYGALEREAVVRQLTITRGADGFDIPPDL